MRELLKAFYLSWVNEWLTVAAMAEHHGLTPFDCGELIGMGREYHEADVRAAAIAVKGLDK